MTPRELASPFDPLTAALKAYYNAGLGGDRRAADIAMVLWALWQLRDDGDVDALSPLVTSVQRMKLPRLGVDFEPVGAAASPPMRLPAHRTRPEVVRDLLANARMLHGKPANHPLLVLTLSLDRLTGPSLDILGVDPVRYAARKHAAIVRRLERVRESHPNDEERLVKAFLEALGVPGKSARNMIDTALDRRPGASKRKLGP